MLGNNSLYNRPNFLSIILIILKREREKRKEIYPPLYTNHHMRKKLRKREKLNIRTYILPIENITYFLLITFISTYT